MVVFIANGKLDVSGYSDHQNVLTTFLLYVIYNMHILYNSYI